MLAQASEPMNETAEFSEVECAISDVFDLQLRFNLFPAIYADVSWIERFGFCAFASDPTDLPVKSTHWIRSVSDALLTECGLEQQFDFDFSSPRKRIALLDAASGIAVANHVAAILLRDRLRTVVARGAVAEIRAKFGADAHRFALRFDGRIPFLPSLADRLATSPTQQWRRVLAELIAACLPDGACGVHGRLQMRFPCAWAAAEEQFVLREPERALLAQLYIAVASLMQIAEAWLFEPSSPATRGQDGKHP